MQSSIDQEALALLKPKSPPPPPSAPANAKYSILETSLTGAAQADESHHHNHQDEEPPGTSGLPSAVFNLATSIVGAGIMALPATMRVLGLPLGLTLILFMALLSELSLEFVVRFTSHLHARSYSDMVHSALGPVARLLSQLCIIANNAGILIVYLIIIADVISGSPPKHPGLLSMHWRWNSRSLVILITIVFVLAPLCSLRRIDSLRFSSAASVALAVVFVALISGVAFFRASRGQLRAPRMLPDFTSWSSVLELLTVIPIMTNAFICHFNIQPIYWELRHRTPRMMSAAGRVSTVVCTLIYVATAVSGYLVFGQSTAPDILTNFDRGSPVDLVIRVGYVAHLMLVFPVIHFSLRSTVDSLVFPREVVPVGESRLRFWGWTGLLLGAVFVGAAFVPNIWIAFQFTGATAGLSLGFIFPALVVLRLSPGGAKKQRDSQRFLAWGMLVLAAGSSCLGLITNIYNVVTHHVD